MGRAVSVLPNDLNPSTHFEIPQDHRDYPEWFSELGYQPGCLYMKGQSSCLTRGVSVIGSREATPYGEKAAYTIARWIAQCGLPVYSGCARGCDQSAHRGALDAGGDTVAVMGGGADVVYPSSAHDLIGRIQGSGGTVSLLPWRTSPRNYTFVLRNRLIVAMSYFVVVVEGTINSGTNSAVSHAQELGIEVYGVPGSIFSEQSKAPNKLISDGCGVISCREDVECALERMGVACNTAMSAPKAPRADLNAVQQAIVDKLHKRPLSLDELQIELTSLCKIDVSVLGVMELHGIIYKHIDGKYYVA